MEDQTLKIRRFRRVDDNHFASGMYSLTGLAEAVKAHRIEVVIDLRDSIRPLLLSMRTYASLQVEYHRYPIDEYAPFTDAHYQDIQALCAGRRALIHCWKGLHRTGTWEVWHRIKTMGASLEEARAHCQEFGTKHPQLWASMEGVC